MKSKRLQRRLGELGYYHRVVDGVMGPANPGRDRRYESTHNLVVDGTITSRLLDRMGLA